MADPSTPPDGAPVQPIPALLPAAGWPYPAAGRTTLLDGRATPSAREALAGLLAHCEEAWIAVGRIRLAAIDLAPGHLSSLARCRVLLGRLDAEAAAAPAHPDPSAGAEAWRRLAGGARDPGGTAGDVRSLLEFLRSGRAEVRSAGLRAWYPDFSVFTGLRMGRGSGSALLVGAHEFVARDPDHGPALSALLLEERSARLALAHFRRLWHRSYDVLPVVAETLERLLTRGERAGAASV